jgi:hypothetical protein
MIFFIGADFDESAIDRSSAILVGTLCLKDRQYRSLTGRPVALSRLSLSKFSSILCGNCVEVLSQQSESVCSQA